MKKKKLEKKHDNKENNKIVYVAAKTNDNSTPKKNIDDPKKIKYIKKSESTLSQKQKQLIRKDPYVYLYQESKKDKKIILPWYIKYLFILIWIFIFFCVGQFIIVTFSYKVMRQWWKNNDGQKYKRVFSIEVLILFNGFKLGEKFYSLFLSEQAQIQSVGAGEFMTQFYYAYNKTNDDDPIGFLLPYHFCESIAVGTLTGGKPDNKAIGDDGKTKEFTNPDSFDSIPWDPDTLTEYGYPTNKTAWKLLLASWGAPLSKDDMTGEAADARLKAWEVDSNFLFTNYNIPWDCPFVLSFMFGTFTDPNNAVQWTADAFSFALGLNPLTAGDFGYNGGWWGYVSEGLGSQKDLTLAMIYSNLYSRVDYSPPGSGDKGGCTGSDWGGAAATAAGSAITTSAFLGGPSNPAGLVTGIIAGTLTFVSSTASSGCYGDSCTIS
jgi:hypothetical protein